MNQQLQQAKQNNKELGQVFTPSYIVCSMLNEIHYVVSEHILKKHIIDNSCGNGAFLIEIVYRYIQGSINNDVPKDEIKNDLERYIHGIDNDEMLVNDCINNLNETLTIYGIEKVNWDIRYGNTLKIHDYDGWMDYVVGNPPYVRTRNLGENYDIMRQYSFSCGGMTDLYIIFFQIGFNMLKDGGKMTYITPSSWLTSLAAKSLREYIAQHKNLVSLVDLAHKQVFGGFTTYTIISTFSNNSQNDSFDYFIYDNVYSLTHVGKLSYDDAYIDNCFYLANKETLSKLKEIKCNSEKKVKVKNGFATLCDDVFIGDNIPQSEITFPILKASKGTWTKCLFPYDKNGDPLTNEELYKNEKLKEYFESNKEKLLKGGERYDNWWLYGRSQAINDVWYDKIAINQLIRSKDDLKIENVDRGKCIYSGLYILGDVSIERIREILINDDFVDYVKALKKYKSGGYYTFSSKDLEQYLNYAI